VGTTPVVAATGIDVLSDVTAGVVTSRTVVVEGGFAFMVVNSMAAAVVTGDKVVRTSAVDWPVVGSPTVVGIVEATSDDVVVEVSCAACVVVMLEVVGMSVVLLSSCDEFVASADAGNDVETALPADVLELSAGAAKMTTAIVVLLL